LKQRLSQAISAKLGLAIAIGVTASLALAPALASGAGELGPANTVYMKDGKGGLRFEAPKTIVAGQELEVLNQTNPKQVGPHTFSLVTKGSLPKTPNARQNCFTPKHICMSIAQWHGVKGNGPVKVNPVEVGLEGWDTLGSTSKKGDSWFTGSKPNTSIVQKVSAAAGTRIYFLCAIHPWMQGSTEVLPAPTS
jgi:hypothetical protein